MTAEVIDEMFDGKYTDFEITWTNKPYKAYYGRFYTDEELDRIEINVLLNSSQVKREAVKYVIYHELLHRFIRNHGTEFRRREHQYPNYTECERVLDYELGKYKFEW